MGNALISMLTLLFLGVVSAQGAAFTDIAGHWAEKIIMKYAEKGLVRGYVEDSKIPSVQDSKTESQPESEVRYAFRPNATITRAEAVTLAFRAVGSEGRRDIVSVLSDVDQSAWYAPYVNEAQGLRIVSGFPDGTFRPHAPVSRAAAAKILVLTSGIGIETTPHTTLALFSDVDPNDWYAVYFSELVKRRIVKGYLDGTLRPADPITRAEFLKILDGLLSD
jgi:hypothetical protein